LVSKKREPDCERRRPAAQVAIRAARVAHETVSEAKGEPYDPGNQRVRTMRTRVKDVPLPPT